MGLWAPSRRAAGGAPRSTAGPAPLPAAATARRSGRPLGRRGRPWWPLRAGGLAQELARVATAPVGHRNRQLWESTRNLYNLVATGALNHRQVDHGLLEAAERSGLLAEEPRQTRRTIASARQVGLDHPRHPSQRLDSDRIPAQASPSRVVRDGGERIKEGR